MARLTWVYELMRVLLYILIWASLLFLPNRLLPTEYYHAYLGILFIIAGLHAFAATHIYEKILFEHLSFGGLIDTWEYQPDLLLIFSAGMSTSLLFERLRRAKQHKKPPYGGFFMSTQGHPSYRRSAGARRERQRK